MHVRCAVARTRKPIAESEESSLVLADQLRKLLNGFNRRACDRRGPIRTTSAKMRFELAWCVGIFFEIGPVGLSIAEKTMHDRARQCTVCSRFDQNRQIGMLHGAVHVNINRPDLPPAPFASPHS